MSNDKDKKMQGRTYQAPQLKKVIIRIDETILLGCKAGNFGPSGTCSTPTVCSSLIS
jgi:hypothetical protein